MLVEYYRMVRRGTTRPLRGKNKRFHEQPFFLWELDNAIEDPSSVIIAVMFETTQESDSDTAWSENQYCYALRHEDDRYLVIEWTRTLTRNGRERTRTLKARTRESKTESERWELRLLKTPNHPMIEGYDGRI